MENINSRKEVIADVPCDQGSVVEILDMEEKTAKPEKKPYISPKLTIHGDIEAITQGGADGFYFDGALTNPHQTPFLNVPDDVS